MALEYSFRCSRRFSQQPQSLGQGWGHCLQFSQLKHRKPELKNSCELLADRRIPQASESHHLRLEKSKRLRKLWIAGDSGNGTQCFLLWYSSPAICCWLLSEAHTGLRGIFYVTSHHLFCSSLWAVLILLIEHWGVQGCVPDASSSWKLPMRIMPALERGWLEVCDCDKAL